MNTPTLKTERLILRKFTDQDMEALFLIFSDEEVNRFLPWYPVKNPEETQKFYLAYITATHDRNNPRSGNVMKRLGMKYCYSYEEQWQPKGFPVIFRMYQLNFDSNTDFVYKKYWNESDNHFVEEI